MRIDNAPPGRLNKNAGNTFSRRDYEPAIYPKVHKHRSRLAIGAFFMPKAYGAFTRPLWSGWLCGSFLERGRVTFGAVVVTCNLPGHQLFSQMSGAMQPGADHEK